MKKKTKKEKINPLVMEQKQIKNIKVDNSSVENDENVIKSMTIITCIIVVLIAIVYGVTELLKEKPEEVKEVVAGNINYDKVSVGMLLNRPYDEYYVLVFNSEDSKAILYSTVLTQYLQKEEKKKIYFCDLNNNLNSPYYNVNNDDKSNPKATKIEDLDFGEITLLKIKNNKINKYIENLDEIKEVLK